MLVVNYTPHTQLSAILINRKVKYNNIEFYTILISILYQFLPREWVLLGQTVEGGSTNTDFFIVIRWPPLRILMVKSVILEVATFLSNYY